MPKRDDISSILIIGAGPIVIGQACEFDYSGVQACKALKDEGYRVVLVNSNPATIMTDPGLADATYIEPITPEFVAKVIEKERPDALLPTMGGQTALNCALELDRRGVLKLFGVELIGAKADVIDKAENRERFREAMDKIGLESPRSRSVKSFVEAEAALEYVGLPAIIRPSFTLGGAGGGVAYNIEEFKAIVEYGLEVSPVHEVLIEESVLGWKEFEMEVVRDLHDNCIIICSIENIDPMGVHTGDSITVAPALTLTDKEYQRMRDASIAVLREIGVETGGSNVQFAINPVDGRMVVIEMNPRVSRSSALASKATGFPIAKVAAKLAVGYSLDELDNDITQGATPASFEPTLDYVVVKIPRFAFEKFAGSSPYLTTSMKSVGEAMAMGRTFKEAVQKAYRSLETGLSGFDEADIPDAEEESLELAVRAALGEPTPDRFRLTAQAMRHGFTVEDIAAITHYDPWFLRQVEEIVATEAMIKEKGLPDPDDAAGWLALKQDGFSDARLAQLTGKTEADVRAARTKAGVRPVYKRVDSCAAEFRAATPYMYSTYETPAYGQTHAECESEPSERKKVVILGGGPNRIGQGIEFDYCCCHAAFALADIGVESIMVNCNPETVSTDYDTSDRLYFEPLTPEDVLEIIETESSKGEFLGVIVQFGGQTPLKLAKVLDEVGVPILGTPFDAIDLAEDRERFTALLNKLNLRQPANATARTVEEAKEKANALGYPLVLRPSNVLGGRAMEVVRSAEDLEGYIAEAVKVSAGAPLLLDSYLRDAIEVDVDVICDTKDVYVAGVMEHIEEAGVHSGDSACALPPHSLSPEIVAEIEAQSRAMALELGVRGLMNVQFAVKGGDIYVLEVNPRASRTAPFVAKATGAPIAAIAAKVMAGASVSEFKLSRPTGRGVAVKEAVMPFSRFPGVDPVLGPEMKSTGEVMGLDETFEAAYVKAQLAAGIHLPTSGVAFVSVKDADKAALPVLAGELHEAGFSMLATGGTADEIAKTGLPVEKINKVYEGRPHIVDAIKNGKVAFICNTTEGRKSLEDSASIRSSALSQGVPCFTTLAAARTAVRAAQLIDAQSLGVRSLQSL
ncbi:MAG: carbamoyl-phosphate synthase large subunit [Maricaulaceae bacterium]|jgi:carbamoyl-phosphate synthase large subunit